MGAPSGAIFGFTILRRDDGSHRSPRSELRCRFRGNDALVRLPRDLFVRRGDSLDLENLIHILV